MKPRGRPCEAWISHEATDEQCAHVMAYLCQDVSGRCFAEGGCSYDGDCFHTDRSAARAAAAAIRKASDDQSPVVGAIMREAAAGILRTL